MIDENYHLPITDYRSLFLRWLKHYPEMNTCVSKLQMPDAIENVLKICSSIHWKALFFLLSSLDFIVVVIECKCRIKSFELSGEKTN